MQRARKLLIFFMTVLLIGTGAVLACRDLCGECLSILTDGTGGTEYLLTASDAEGAVYALGERYGEYLIVQGDRSGRQEQVWKLTADGLPESMRPAALYPASGGAVYLGVYDTGEPETRLKVFRITETGATAELLVDQPCGAGTLPQQMENMRLSAFSEVDGVVTFAVIHDDTAQFYRRAGAVSGVEMLECITTKGLRTAVALSNGALLTATDDTLVRTDRDSVTLRSGAIIIQTLQAGTGIYCVDGASLEVFYADFADWKPFSILQLEKDAYDLDDCTDLSLTRDGGVLLMMDGQKLLLDLGSSVTDLSAMLHRSVWMCVLILAGLAAAVLIVSTLLWYVICEQKKLRLPLLLRWGVPAAAAAALILAALLQWMVQPSIVAAAERQTADLADSVAAQLLADGNWDDALAAQVGESLAAAQSGHYLDTAVNAYTRGNDGVWTVSASNSGLQAGQRAELSSGFDLKQVERARQDGSASWVWQGGGNRLLCAWSQGRSVMTADIGLAAVIAQNRAECGWIQQALGALAVAMMIFVLTVLSSITVELRRVTHAIDRLNRGEQDVTIRMGSGDEIASLADSVTAFGRTLESANRRQGELGESYHRFVPERVLSLLGKTSILEVDKTTFAARNLATMMIGFSFPPQVYEKSGKELFDNINEILERTAAIVTRNGGAVFNFAYDGYDAVFEHGSAAAVSTAVAVQQEVLNINRGRELAGKPQVRMRIALDEGNVMFGVVGDETQIEPTSISSSFATAKHLLSLCDSLEAYILCTEAVIGEAGAYGSRYVGKCREGGRAIRTYEIFDGDPYEARKIKAETGKSFSEGVYALYSGEIAQAKRVFLNLVHHDSGDGGARYYLYLADQMERHPEYEANLDLGE